MNIIIVDDEHLALRSCERAVRNALPDSALFCFDAPSAAIAHAEIKRVDIAFLDIAMGGMDGFALSERLQKIHAQTNIIFVTGHSEYAINSYSVPASGYLLKPVSTRAVTRALNYLRYPVAKTDKKLRVQCFGNFDVFAESAPLHFPRSKSKELFAYLIHRRGASCTTQELVALLFAGKGESDSLRKQIQTYISVMMKVLRGAGAKDVIIKKFNTLAVDTAKVDCDYYNFMQGNADSVNLYLGEYMSNYSWAEFTVGHLDRITLDIKNISPSS